MKGRTPTREEKRFHDLLAQHVGCICCFIDTGRDRRNTWCSIHHIDGRTKHWAHWFVLPLCAGHHQDGSGAPGLLAVHPFKAQFEAQYGRQMDLLADCIRQLIEQGHTLPANALAII